MAQTEFKTFFSIGIPTWNRANWLENNLDKLIEQIEKYRINHVEIFISDNASDDNTSAVCQAALKKHSYVTYFRQETNVGANLNFQTVMEKSSGSYVWLMGDDDLVAEDVIPKIIETIALHRPTIAIGGALFDDTLEKATHLQFDRTVMSNRELFYRESLIELAGKISGLIIEKQAFLLIRDQARSIITSTNTPWPHLIWVILLLNNPAHPILVLPYGINLLVASAWYNTLFKGEDLIRIHFVALQTLLVALKPKIDKGYYDQLSAKIVSTRIPILFKCVLYATYQQPHSTALQASLNFLPYLLGFKNKFLFLAFLVMPLLTPVFLRKCIFGFFACIPLKMFSKLRLTIARLKQGKDLLQDPSISFRQQFNEEQL